eukprot:1178304-Prorocentrum_minimum.AAC.1
MLVSPQAVPKGNPTGSHKGAAPAVDHLVEECVRGEEGDDPAGDHRAVLLEQLAEIRREVGLAVRLVAQLPCQRVNPASGKLGLLYAWWLGSLARGSIQRQGSWAC